MRGDGARFVALLIVIVAAGGALAGCWPTPGTEWYDGGPPPDPCDGGCVDAPDLGDDMGVDTPRERMCEDGEDNDEDGLADCADFDCAGSPRCCTEGEMLLQEDWSSADLSFRWEPLPSDDPNASPTRSQEDGVTVLTGWPSEDVETRALRYGSCLPAALGLELRAEFTPSEILVSTGDPFTCGPTGTPCALSSALIVTRAPDARGAEPLLEDLGVRVHAGVRHMARTDPLNQSMLRVTQQGTELGRTPLVPGVRYAVTLRLSPDVSGSEAELRADVSVAPVDGSAEPVVLGGYLVAPTRALLDGVTGCERLPGLYPAVEMTGVGVAVGPVSARALECANPSQFVAPTTTPVSLTAVALGLPESYGGGGFGAPTLSSAYNAVTDLDPRWDLFVEATNDPPELATVARVGYALAHARTSSFDATASAWDVSAAPRLGEDPPSCASDGACAGASVREPYLLARRTSGDVLDDWTLAFAFERGDGSHELRVEQDVAFSPDVPLGGTGVVVLAPSDTASCVDLRDPALVPVGAAGGYALFFVCLDVAGSGSVWALRLGADFAPVEPRELRVVLRPSDLGEVAANGIRGVEPQVRADSEGAALRLWMIARDVTDEPTLVMAFGEVRGTTGLWPPPGLSPYPANPVMRSDDAALGGCPGTCRLTDLAIADDVSDVDGFRFVLARRVNDISGMRYSELIPLEQPWRIP